MTFQEFFFRATGTRPFPYQVRLATAERMAQLLQAPTGAGKTAATILSWAWRRRFAADTVRKQTPRRLVYCLPMRVLVEQTRDNAITWLERLGLAGEGAANNDGNQIDVAVLMGGEEQAEWDLYPEQDVLIIGTQDMLLSRALNRGYGMSRYRWPIHFALLGNDCLWVHDEVQLMGSGLTTSAQLAAFRASYGVFGPVQELWMSATMRRDWLATYDFSAEVPRLEECALSQQDLQSPILATRLSAKKAIRPVSANMLRLEKLAEIVAGEHHASSHTLVIVNTVGRAVALFDALERCIGSQWLSQHVDTTLRPELLLIHSRFRPTERAGLVAKLMSPLPPAGRITVSTQVVEAGIDISAATLFTELAPWPSLVQRFGRCNRYGEYDEANIFWVDMQTGGRKSEAAPYEDVELDVARSAVTILKDAGPLALERHLSNLGAMANDLLAHDPQHLIRRRDFIELYDTSPDLAGNDLDVSRFIRSTTESDVLVFWRDVQVGQIPDPQTPEGESPSKQELCQIPTTELREFLKDARLAFVWDYLDARWVRASTADVIPGKTYLLPSYQGGYLPDTGWSPKSRTPVPSPPPNGRLPAPEANDDDHPAEVWQTLATHTDRVTVELDLLLQCLGLLPNDHTLRALQAAVRWHDRGKAHPIFQRAFLGPPSSTEIWAKAPRAAFQGYYRGCNPTLRAVGFRHELAGALAALQAELPDLACYLVAAHHGKVRLTIRSLPHETRPPGGDIRFARGIWDGDILPSSDLGRGHIAPASVLSLQSAELGLSPTGESSWTERMLRLRDDERLGPYRLAFLEMLVRVADMRASASAESGNCLTDIQQVTSAADKLEERNA